MTIEQVQSIVDRQSFPGRKSPVTLLETHISWVTLTPDYAFKIKKPVQFSFLDFNTVEKRAFYCQEEVRLNRRLAPDMYLGVLPVCIDAEGRISINEHAQGEIIDHAVWMKRMDDSRQMDQLLLKNTVKPEAVKVLAKKLAAFHRSVILPAHETGYRPGSNRADFEDLFQLEKTCVTCFGASATKQLRHWRFKVEAFLDWHEPRLHQRADGGYWVDGHGDLHGRNIFLLDDGPVVFDCVEFNPHFRKSDVLSELAFLCMELEADGHPELEQTFMDAYLNEWICMPGLEDRALFRYFKAYRANIRLKVTLLAWEQHPTEVLEKTAGVYWKLLGRYMESF